MKTTKMFMMAMMMTMATSAMATTTTKPRNDRDRHTECTCQHDCRKQHDPNRRDPNRCPTCGKQLPPSTCNWHSQPQPDPKPAPNQPQKPRQERSYGNQQSRVFGSHR